MDVLNNNLYFLLHGLTPNDTWVRMGNDGTWYAWDSATKTDTVWAAFGTPEGTGYDTAMNPCSKSAAVVSRSAKYSGPVGNFDWALEVRYQPGGCADAGLEHEIYLPWVGLLHRTETTIAGPRDYDLIYARLGTVTVISEKEVTFGLSLDKPVYTANLMPPVVPQLAVPVMTARLHLRVTQDAPLELTFASGQTYELVVKDDKGQVVYRWSDGKAFTAAFRKESFGPGERNYVVIVRLADQGDQPLAAGKYVAEAWLTTAGQRIYTASVGFEIRNVY